MTPPKKLIEVALPLEAINAASAREKSIRHGHPSTLHLWWARRPLAAARAVIFASLVDDPDDPAALPAFVEACRALPNGANTALHDTPRMRLFDFIERLVTWEATTDEAIINQARDLIRIATGGNPPPLLDPFAGGGSIPLEAQRLGLEAYASDLNPVAVMINKAQIEIPPRFASMPPVNPDARAQMFAAKPGKSKSKPADTTWRGATGLANDVRYYGAWMRERAFEKIGHLYPLHNGETVIAWIWARTVKSPNPAVDAHVPLVRSWILSKKKGRMAWVEPIVEPVSDGTATHRIRYVVRREQDGDTPPADEGTVNRKGGRDIISDEPIPFEFIRAEGKAGCMGAHLIAIVTEGKGGRNYHSPTPDQVRIAYTAEPEWRPSGELPEMALGFRVQLYGMDEYHKLFTSRQLVALTTFSDLVSAAREEIYADAVAAGLPDDDTPLRDGGRGARAYAEAVGVYLSFAVDRLVEKCNSLSSWQNTADKVRGVFSRQAISMLWDYVDVNPFSGSSGNFGDAVEWVAEATESIFFENRDISHSFTRANQTDAAAGILQSGVSIISTDPPYFDLIGYADLSDFFYIWLRSMIGDVYPGIFGTMLVPKEPELIANPHRHGGRAAANVHFETGLQQAFVNMHRTAEGNYPLSVYYAFKQQEADEVDDDPAADNSEATGVGIMQDAPDAALPTDGRASTGWETMLTGLIDAGFSINGTWPVRSERPSRTRSLGSNALASSIVLVCRPRPTDAPSISRRAFVDALRRELPAALKALQSGNIAPVDLAQASIGPGMAIYSRYSRVLEADGRAMGVRAALALINQELDAYLAEQDGEIDADTRFAVAWFEQYGFSDGEFGVADTLARAKNTSVAGVSESGLVVAARGRVRLIHWKEYDAGGYDPVDDARPTVWEATHHLIERLHTHGETGSGALIARMRSDVAAAARDLAYRLYAVCERKGWAEHARDYNALVISWSGIGEEAARLKSNAASNTQTNQGRLFE